MKYQYILIALVGAGLSILADATGVFHFLEMKSLDARYELRSDYFRQPEVSDQIVVVGIDDASIAAIREPFILWDTFFAEIIEALGSSGAGIIGLDLIWTKKIDEFVTRPGKQKNALRRALLIAKNKYHSSIVMGIGAVSRTNVDADAIETDTSLPMREFGAIVGRSGFGVVNTVPDADNYIRRVKLLYRSGSDDNRTLPGFAAAVASRYLGADLTVVSPDRPLLINYQLNRTFRILPFSEVLAAARAGDTAYFERHFKDRIALLGVTNVSGDILPSPVAQETPGILIHAHAIDMLINDNLLDTGKAVYTYLLYLLIAFAVTFYASRSGIRVAIALTVALMLAYSLVNIVLFDSNLLLPLFTPLLLIVWSLGVTYFYRFVSEERSKRRLASFFGSYVNEQVVKEILSSENPIALEGKREKICILFSDVRSFTTYSEKLPPEEVVKTLNEYFSAMTGAILDNNGTVDKFIGDGLMAFFGAPVHIDNPTLSAVRAALEMRSRLQELNRKWASEGRAQLDNGIGLHTGQALVGNIGSEKKFDYTAIGDSVNTASRVEGVTKTLAAPILITAAAYGEVEGLVVCEPRGEVPLKGRAPIFVYEVKGTTP